MMIDFDWSGGFVLGIIHTDEAIVETEEEQFQFCTAIVIHLGFFNIAVLFNPS
jgi:hypothetical protein